MILRFSLAQPSDKAEGRRRAFIVLSIFVVALFAGILLNRLSLIEIREEVPVQPEYRQKTELEVNRIKNIVEIIRGKNLTSNISIVFINTEWAIKNWAPKPGEAQKELLLMELFYKVTFFIDWNDSIINLTSEWVGMFIAATSGYTLYINVDYFSPDSSKAKSVLAHEITHILQYEHFDVKWPQKTDPERALSALVEGDASFTQRLYCLATKECIPSSPWTVDFKNLYLSLRAFPYIYGEKFVEYIYERGGWELVNKCYEKPPPNTYMVMFPEAYMRYLLNQEMLNNQTYLLGLQHKRGTLLEDTVGAYYLYLIVGKWGNEEKGLAVAKEWDYDYIAIYMSDNNLQIDWYIAFKTQAGLMLFRDVFLSLLDRYGIKTDEDLFLRAEYNGEVLYKIALYEHNIIKIETLISGDLISHLIESN